MFFSFGLILCSLFYVHIRHALVFDSCLWFLHIPMSSLPRMDVSPQTPSFADMSGLCLALLVSAHAGSCWQADRKQTEVIRTEHLLRGVTL